MVKNYISTGILLIGLLFSINYSFSQSNHLVTFTGNPSDFNEAEKITGGDNVDYYVTFNETTMYFGAFRTGGQTFAAYDHFTIYFDTDPRPNLNSGSGSTTGHLWDSRTPTLPFRANHRIAIRNNGTGESFHHRRTAAWIVEPPSGAPIIQYTTPTSLEIAIDISKLDSPKGIYFSMFMSYDGGFFGFSDPNYPIDINTTTGNTTGYFGGIGITSEGAIPTDHYNTPILNSLPEYDNPSPGQKYAYMEFIDGHYDVDGDIELVAGGTAIIRPGSALTVNGTFTHNGLVTLQSSSASYSSLIADAVVGSGKTQYHRHVNQGGTGTTGHNDLVSAPLSGQTFGAFAAANPNILEQGTQRAFGIYDKDLAKYRNYYTDTHANTPLEPAMGYRAAAKVDGSLVGGAFTYTGTVNTGTISTPIRTTSDDFGMWNLIGNPYPSYIDINALILNNILQFHESEDYDAIYGYNGNPNESNLSGDIWEVRNSASGLDITPGQGFYIASSTSGGTFTFTPELRVPGTENDFIASRAAIDNVSLRLTVSNSSAIRHTDIHFHSNGTLDHDRGYDAGQIGNPNFTIFSKLVVDSTNRDVPLVIQTLPYSILDTEVSVPIGIKAAQGEQLTISATNTDAILPLPEAVEVYFEDAVAQTSTLLSVSTIPHNHHYIFTPSTNLTGEMGRFSLRFTNKSLSVTNPNFDALDVYSPLNTGNLIVRGNVNEVTSLEIFDLNGRMLQTFSVQPNQAVNRFEVSNLATGIYIVKLNNKTQSKIKKIQLNNKL